MKESNFIILEKNEGIARITFDRPKHNVFNIPMLAELNDVLQALLGDDALKCVVMSGRGPSWSAGVDVADHEPANVDQMISTFTRVFQLLHRLPVPTIAAVHGRALGGGMEIAIACDMVIASESALFGQPEIKLGFLPPYAAVRLPRLVGPARAIEICTTGMIYTARQFHEMGLVSRLCSDDSLTSELDRVLKEITACSPLIIRLNKQAVTGAAGGDPLAAMDAVNRLFLDTLMKTEDTLEGIRSFVERRRPTWKNR